MAKPRGYPLPDGDCYTEDLCPLVVCIPNRDEYFQAFWGTLHYLATWIAWQRDVDKRGKDAAESWRFANEATEVGNRMGCLEDLITDVNDIKEFLLLKKDCCDANITYDQSTTFNTLIVPGQGDDPTVYGETEVADWDEWLEHVCYQAHLYVDQLIRQAGTIETGLETGAIAIGVIAAALALVTLLATGGVLSFPFLALAASALAAGGAGSMFAQAAEDIEAARDDIVCALMLGQDVGQEVEDALTIGSSWTLFFSLIDYDTATAIIYEGGRDGVYLPTETRDDCGGCIAPPTGIYLHNLSQVNWISDDLGETWSQVGAYGEIAFNVEYWFLGQGTAGEISTWDGVSLGIDVQWLDAKMIGAPPGTNVRFVAIQADTTPVEDVWRLVPGDYPFSYAQVATVWTGGTNLNYPDGYPLSLKFAEYVA